LPTVWRIAASAAQVARTFATLVLTVTSIQRQRRSVAAPGGEVGMNKMIPKFPTSFGEAVKQVFVGSHRAASPDLRDLSDQGLVDIGLTRRTTDFEAAKPFWLA
jgi:uncharacterized protein YjiS (DUF1127 family)